VRFALIEEPGEHCWTLRRDGDRLRGTVVHLNRMYRTKGYNAGRVPGQPPPEDEGKAVAAFECSLREFAEAVVRMVRDINARYTAEDFKRTRNPGIPLDLVGAVGRADRRTCVAAVSAGSALRAATTSPATSAARARRAGV
jgi:hypothetical protein